MGFKVVPSVPGEDSIGGGLSWADQVRCSFNIPAPWRNGWHMRAQAGNSMDCEDIFKILLYSFTQVRIFAKTPVRVDRPLFSSAFLAGFTPDQSDRPKQRVRSKSLRLCRKTTPQPMVVTIMVDGDR